MYAQTHKQHYSFNSAEGSGPCPKKVKKECKFGTVKF